MAKNLQAGLRQSIKASRKASVTGAGIFSLAPLDLRFALQKTLDPRVTFTRASTGTYVGSDGVLQRAVTNLLLRSEAIATSPWFNSNVTLTNNTSDVLDPVGGSTATKVVSTGSSSTFGQPVTLTATIYAGSIWLRSSTGSISAQLIVYLGGAPFTNIGTTNATITTTWQRFSVITSAATATIYNIQLNNIGAGTVYAWGAQLEQSSTVGEYIPTTSTINSAPRFDHNPTTGESLGLLVEEARTNSIRNNTGVGAVAGTPGTLPTNWSQSNNTGLAANVVGTGTENGITYIDLRVNGTTTGTGQTNIVLETSLGVAATTGQTWSLSPYLKIQTGSLTNVGVVNLVLQENTAVGTAVTAGAQAITIPTSPLGTYRPTFTRTLSGGVTVAAVMPYIQININTGLVVDFTIRIGLPQLEQGAFATSPILTSTATATRAADVASITGSNFSSWYNQTASTIYSEAASSSGAAYTGYVYTIGADFNNGITHYRQADFQPVARIRNAGTDEYGANGNGAIWTGTLSNKFALAVSSTSGRQASNGSLNTGSDDTSISIPTAASMTIGAVVGGSNQLNGTIKRLTYWPIRLPNPTLQAITAP
jgi:hypothetical protein